MDSALLEQISMSQLLALNWQDYIEIIFFSGCFYRFSEWLKKDRQKNLLGYFYAFCLVALISYMLDLHTITSVLFVFWPAVVLLFMFMHQETLQKNIIALKNITIAHSEPNDWMSFVLQGVLKALNDNKPMLILIENTDAISSFVKAQYPLNATITEGLIDMIFAQQVQDPKQLVWLTREGICKGINTSFKASWHPNHYKEKNAWIDDALIHTAKCDVLIMQICPETHTCTIALRGTLHTELSVEQSATMISNHIDYQMPFNKKRIEYGIANKKSRVEQRSP